ncbi:siderophore-iron reductase FhuF [Bacillus kexueae]|uniref:siderophore-iron reductase FhuF n=1 Tax=Aeribacillus kexueae TaxID=2078952 RepID=UPI001FB018F9|nr:siderophore-iron reductase FhuF [Bacillus kexueae]
MSTLTIEQWQLLQSFGLTFETVESELSIESIDLLDEQRLNAYLERIKSPLSANKISVCGSLLIKRYGVLAAIGLYSMSMWNKVLNVELTNVSIQSHHQNGVWSPKLHLKTLTVEELEGNREEKRTEWIIRLFKKHIDPLISAVSKIAKVSPRILWENVAVYILWMYESIPIEQLSCNLKKRVTDDFLFVVEQARGDMFGQYDHNPLTPFAQPKRFNEQVGKEIRMRKTCCLYYKTNDEQIRCQTCPVQFTKEGK